MEEVNSGLLIEWLGSVGGESYIEFPCAFSSASSWFGLTGNVIDGWDTRQNYLVGFINYHLTSAGVNLRTTMGGVSNGSMYINLMFIGY